MGPKGHPPSAGGLPGGSEIADVVEATGETAAVGVPAFEAAADADGLAQQAAMAQTSAGIMQMREVMLLRSREMRLSKAIQGRVTISHLLSSLHRAVRRLANTMRGYKSIQIRHMLLGKA